MSHYTYWTIDEEYESVSPRDPQHSWYWIGWCQLKEGQNMLEHLSHKNWFTEPMFWELLKIAKHYNPTSNYDKEIYEVGKWFQYRHMSENWEHFDMLHRRFEEKIKRDNPHLQ